MSNSSANQAQSLLAGNVRRLRGTSGWTQEQAADAIGIAPRHYQKIEAGTVNVTVATLANVARAFGVTVSVLFAEEDGGARVATRVPRNLSKRDHASKAQAV